ncbi:MerR family transcriptional regulator [Gluconobacter oxydans]|uniref:MerR family transcriptional regulator n=1 Tax=Gluconobacter thailandicus TaxID=257438 RepID=UPI0002995FFC|nr:helix-turn-helix domain-containing protein [Gluconobacter thailandicus]AFW01938.1 MerR family transcriptional regulator [Gluconobacter oxydans H24]ANQ42482.1 MerR family transcriptional regulator [Gluconobacter oxydans]GAN91315.1 transcriptional regulator MerR [Gluconobacter frateurii M-2]
MPQTYSIGEMGRLTDTKVETIRYYERAGLLPSPPRSAGNYRVYTQEHLGRLGFIRRARELGFPLNQVRMLLDLAAQTDRSCEDVDILVREHILEIDRKIRDLHSLRQELNHLLKQCQHGEIGECRIIDALGR